MMTLYSKVLEPTDYAEIGKEIEYYKNIESTLGDLVRPQHPDRMWEYGRILKIISYDRGLSIVDIGGSGSALPQCFATLSHNVTIIDFDDESDRINKQNQILNTDVKFIASDFLKTEPAQYDVVVCVSTIEHVPDDDSFFVKILDSCKPGGLVYITCDFFTSPIHPNEPPTYKNWVNRTYTKEKLLSMANLASEKGFKLYGGKYDWVWKGAQVYNYNFASLILERNV